MDKSRILSRRNYGSIPHLHGSRLGDHDKYLHEGQDAIIRKGGRDKHDKLYVSLKLDGTNVGVVKKEGRLHALQRKGYDCASSPYKMHHEFDSWVRERDNLFQDLLSEGERVAGEWLWQASGIRYGIKGDPFFAFDIFRSDNKRLPWLEMVERVEGAGLRVPEWRQLPNLEGENDIASILKKLTGASNAITPIDEGHEGIVARIERKGVFDFMGKWVRADFEPGKYLPGVSKDEGAVDVLNVVLR